MTVEAQGAESPSQEAPALTPAEQASVEVGQRGLSEPKNPNEMPASGPQRPEHVPEKFWDAEKGEVRVDALAKSYAELERVRSAPKEAEAEAAQATEEAPVGADGKIEKKAEEAPAADAVNPLTSLMDKAREEFGTGQAVSEETTEALVKAGVPAEVLATYLKGLELISQQAITSIHGYVEGEENYTAMAKWAAEKLSDAELEAYNNALDNPQLRENAVRGLYARYTTARPSEGRLVTPQGDTSGAGDVYTDRAQLIADQRDPRYQSDAAFRQTVMDKLSRSQRTGFQLAARPMFSREIVSR